MKDPVAGRARDLSGLRRGKRDLRMVRILRARCHLFRALADGHFHNPILAGYYPDPSVARVGDKFYLVNSTFAHWPGIPIHESTDLVHWTLVGHALNDPSKVNFDGLGISRGVFAPSIHFHDGTSTSSTRWWMPAVISS